MQYMGRELGGDMPQQTEPVYYRHTISLDAEDLKRLGIEEIPTAGTEFHLEAVGTICHSSSSDHDGDGDIDSVCVTLQFTHMDATVGDSPKKERNHAKNLYGKHDEE